MACGPRIMRLGGGSEWRMRQRRASLPQTVEPCKRLRHGSGASAKKRRAVRRPAVYESSAVAAVINTNDTTTEAEMANPAISVSPSIHIT